MKVLSFGAGVQTVTLATISCLSDFERPDFAIFADTGWESTATYAYLDTFTEWARIRGMEIVRSARGNIRRDALDPSHRFASMPLFTSMSGETGMLRRQCTREYKIDVVQKIIRARAGLQPGQHWKGEPCELWLGISLDEVVRMKENRDKWIVNRWPLVEKRMTRGSCIEYLKAHGLPVPPKSACIGCPYHDDGAWLDMKKNRQKEFEDVCDFDDKIRRTQPGVKSPVFLHRSLAPLRDADLGQNQGDLFAEECEGHCGL
ncbi:MAG: hypothetical protein QME66_13445 [Candidatus Eisenbacteria bacterium]|nr:hypothetical protein [Candidatus Eisenbacteria bacterium]